MQWREIGLLPGLRAAFPGCHHLAGKSFDDGIGAPLALDHYDLCLRVCPEQLRQPIQRPILGKP